jgi:hypothetical protein
MCKKLQKSLPAIGNSATSSKICQSPPAAALKNVRNFKKKKVCLQRQ